MITKTWHAELKSHGVKSPVVSDVKPELGARGRGDRRKNPVDKERKEGRRCAERSCREYKIQNASMQTSPRADSQRQLVPKGT